MNLLQNACLTYDVIAKQAGKADEKEPLAPISHIMAKPNIEIILDQNGGFIFARAFDKNAPKIIIPVTEESAGRTRAPCAHPLCDQLSYVSPADKVKHTLYLEALSDWAGSEFSHPKLKAILAYVRGGTILSDLAGLNVIKLDAKGAPADEKLMVCWTVNGLGEELSGHCWEDKALWEAFIKYYEEKCAGKAPALCMISGEMETPAGQHPKGIVPINGNAKLISANDSLGFTYRGRFCEPSQAATVGYTASQKAHSALRWLIANQGVTFGGQTFLCWNPNGKEVPEPTGSIRRKNSDAPRAVKPTQYQEQLHKSLYGWKAVLPDEENVVIASFNAATTGRLAVTYYNELKASDYLERLKYWEETSAWENGQFGIQSPSLFQIISWAFGMPRNGKTEIKDEILSQQMQRLVACKLEKGKLPLDIERALLERASNLVVYEAGNRQQLLFTACAAIRKYHIDQFKEEWNMGLDKACKDRSYLFGRLLAVAEAVENSTYDKENQRETNAMRMQKAYSIKPMTTWRLLEEKLIPYYKRLNPGLCKYYKDIINEILEKIEWSDHKLNKKLDDIYLLGYYHQRSYRKEKEPEAKEEI